MKILSIFRIFGLILAGLIQFPIEVKSQDSAEVNLLFIYQEDIGKRALEQAKEYFTKNPVKKIQVGTVHSFFANDTGGAVKLVNEFCKFVDDAINGPNPPQIALDFTRIGVPSEAVKVVLKGMQIPTIAATFGQEDDIKSWRNLSPKQKNYLIQVSPPADVVIQLVRSIVDIQNMTSAVVMFEPSIYEMYHKYKSLLQNMPTRHLLTKIEHHNISGQVDRLVHVDIVNFFIAAEPDQISDVIQQSAQKFEKRDGPYFSDEFAWYSISLGLYEKEDNVKFPRCNQCDVNVTLVHFYPDPSYFKTNERKTFFTGSLTGELAVKNPTLTDLFYFDMAVDTIFTVGNMINSNTWNLEPRNLTCAAYPDQDKLEKIQDEITLDLYPAFIEAGKENAMGAFHIEKENGKNYPEFEMEFRRIEYDQATVQARANTKIGTWKTGFDDNDNKERVIFVQGRDLVLHQAQTVFRIVTYIQPPFVMKLNDCTNVGPGNKYVNCFYGYCISLLDEIRKELNFSYTIRDVPDGYGYMSKEEPHNWNGMVLELKERRADIALGAMSVMAERESVVDFTVPYYDLVGISILMKKPRPVTSLFKFLTVLENDVWMCILGAYFFTSLLMWIFDRWSPYSYQNNREKYEDDEEKREFNLKECLWFCMTSLTPQGGGEAPKNLSGRLVAATWWLFGFIIIASYTANLAAFLTVSRLDAPIESLEDLSKQYKVQYAPLNGSSAWIYFDRMAHIEHRFYEIWKDMSLNDSMTDYERSQLAVWDYPVSDKYTKMWQAMIENKPPQTFEEAVERVRGKDSNDSSKQEADGFAFLGDATDIRYQVMTNCDLQMIGEEFSRKPYALAVQQGSPLKDQLNDAILKLLNQRFLEQLKEDWWNNDTLKAKNCPKVDEQSDGISIHNIGGVFIVIFVGILLACCTLIFEYWWYRKRDVTEELAEMSLPPPKEFGPSYTSSPPTVEKTNFNTQYDKPPDRSTLPSIENSW